MLNLNFVYMRLKDCSTICFLITFFWSFLFFGHGVFAFDYKENFENLDHVSKKVRELKSQYDLKNPELAKVNSIINNEKVDILKLKNGRQFQGTVGKIHVKSKNEVSIKFNVEEQEYWIPSEDIQAIQFGNTQSQPYLKLKGIAQRSDSEKCRFGRNDADAYHGKGFAHFAYGFLFGPFAVIGAAIASPTPDSGSDTMVMSENTDYFDDPSYLNCYSKKAKKQNIGNTLAGWGSWVLIFVLATAG